MNEYALRDEDANELVLNDSSISQPARGSLMLGDDTFEYENRIVENSALPGSVKLGKTRLRQRELIVRFSRADDVEADFRAADNALLAFLEKTVLLVDKTNSLKVRVAPSDYRLKYDDAARYHSADNEIRLILLDPFWEALTEDNVSSSLSTGVNTIPLTNNGFLATPPRLEFTAPGTDNIAQLQIYIDQTKEGIQIDDSLFGTIGYDELIVDCKEGTLTLEGFDRTQSILPGTGFFTIPVGASSLKIDASDDVDLELYFSKRYFI